MVFFLCGTAGVGYTFPYITFSRPLTCTHVAVKNKGVRSLLYRFVYEKEKKKPVYFIYSFLLSNSRSRGERRDDEGRRVLCHWKREYKPFVDPHGY